MPTEIKTIETLIKEARLSDAQKQFDTFLALCLDKRTDLIQNQGRTAALQDKEITGTLTREDGIERNRITLSFINEISAFRKQLSNYFGVGDSREFFEKAKNRDDVILAALELRVTDKQYLIVRQLKDGNSSIVFQLKKAHTDQDAIAMVLKIAELSDETKADYAKVSTLRHRNIIKLLDHELSGFPYFIITEFVHGENMSKAIAKTGARPLNQVVDWLYQLADALDYMRHKGILHTNVRPSKVYIDEEMNVMISPFDANKTSERTFSRFQDVCFYGSPELLAVDGEALTLAQMCISDQYSLGLIAYKALTGKALFEGTSISEVLHSRQQFANNKIYRAAKLSVFPSGALGNILRRMLNEDPSKRYPNLHEVVRVMHPHTHKSKKTDTTNALRESYRRCLSRNQALISDFYTALFDKLPAVRVDFQTPKRQLAMMQMAVDILIDIDEKQPLLTALMSNDKHKSYALDTFDVFIDTLLETLKNNDAEWDNVALDWQLLREKTIKTIVDARKTT
jgi:serine/threonine protein kinase